MPWPPTINCPSERSRSYARGMSSKSAPTSFSRPEKLLLALMAAIQFSHIVDFMILMPLGPQLMRIFGIGPQEFGLLVSSYTFAAGLSGFLASFFVDRFDRKTSLLFFYVGFAVSTIACAIAPSYFYLLAARCLAGMFGGVLGSLVMSIVSDAISYERRGSAMGIVMGSFSVASVLGVPFSLYLATEFSWHAPFAFLGVVSLPVIALAMKYVPSMNAHVRKGGAHGAWESIGHILKTPNQQLALLFMFCLVLGQFSIIPFLSPSFVSNAGMREDQLPLLYLFGGLCSMVASPTVGRLADKYGKRQVFSFSVLLSLPPIWIITHLGPNPVWILLVISSLFFIVMSGRMVPAMAMVSSTATPEYRGSFMSVTSAVQQLSAALASWVAGMIVVSGEGGRLMNYEAVGYVAIAFSVLAFIAARLVRTGVA